jgi:hypothetical protein
VKVYLYGLLCDLEVELSELVARSLPHEAIVAFALKKEAESSVLEEGVRHSASEGVDEHPVNRLYLGDLVDIARNHGLHRHVHYTDKEFKKALDPIVKLRNAVAHPVNPLITAVRGVRDLQQRMVDMEDAIFRLRHCC